MNAVATDISPGQAVTAVVGASGNYAVSYDCKGQK